MKKKSKSWKISFQHLKAFKFYHVIIYVLLGLIMFGIMFSNVKPEKINVQLFSNAEKTIVAPHSFEDREATELLRKEAADKVPDQFIRDKDKAYQQIARVENFFEVLIETKNKIAELEKVPETSPPAEEEGDSAESQEDPEPIMLTDAEKLKLLEEALEGQVPDRWEDELKDENLLFLLGSKEADLTRYKNASVTAINNAMSRDIHTVEDASEAKNLARTELSQSGNVPSVIINISSISVIPNVIYDSAQTQEKRQQAIDAVEPVRVSQGDTLVKAGQFIDREIYRLLTVAGFVNQSDNLAPYAGLIIIIGLMIFALVYLFKNIDTTIHSKNTYLTMYLLIFSITLILLKIFSFFQTLNTTEIGYIAPVAMGAMLIKMLINDRIAIFSSIIFGICGSFIFNMVPGTMNYTVGSYLIISAVASVLFLNQHNRRLTILQTGLFVSFINVVTVIALVLLTNRDLTGMNELLDLGINGTMAVGSGVVSAVLTIGILPFFEVGFGMLSTMKLLELSNPNHPLLRKILMETPGTYHHSVMVANLSESACEAVGANGLLARVASYYHDIGKTKRPHYFIENQMGRANPHDKLPPQTSKNIIIAHATDGAQILRDHNMPKEIVDIAAQHHGTTLLKFFYHKAKEQNENIKEEEYRYPGPKATSKEAAIVGTADSIEAAVRSLNNPTPDKIETIVKAIIKDRLQDGQYSDCDLTFKELEEIGKSFCETLQGIFHSRIEYPKGEEEES
ncbi:HD family phosphohydrolase [Sutcliffiella horikoshii]|uniref:HD family phosphohydrolase n=1 Tax=Sutcliffiella horikoshii TaxID=79883 RepID=UPI001CBF2ACA|nr:HD family phosphohydrolase [Sutcliffiella horikoshii]UAL46202.1 HD family phosphohydrolase [Sutcliffiella horikoshii]